MWRWRATKGDRMHMDSDATKSLFSSFNFWFTPGNSLKTSRMSLARSTMINGERVWPRILRLKTTIVTLIKASKLHNVQRSLFPSLYLSPLFLLLSFRLFIVRFLRFFLIHFIYVNDNHKGRNNTFNLFQLLFFFYVDWIAHVDLWTVLMRLATDLMRKRINVSAGTTTMNSDITRQANLFNSLESN